MRCEPCLQVGVQLRGDRRYLIGFGQRNRPRSFVVSDVASLAKCFQSSDHPAIGFQSEGQGLDDSIVMLLARCPIALGRQSRGCDLQRSIVGDGQPPIRAEARYLTVCQISLRDAEQIGDLLPRRLVRCEPTVAQPVWQVHARPQ